MPDLIGPLVRLIALALLFALASYVDHIAKGPETTYSVSHAAWDSSNTAPFIIKAPFIKTNSFEISFDALARADQFNNFFQTSDHAQGIRLELQHPGQLFLALGDISFTPIAQSFPLNKWHHFILRGDNTNGVEVTIDNKIVYASRDDIVKKLKFDFDTIVIGAGYAQQRAFDGIIKNFTVSARYTGPIPYLFPYIAFIICITFGAVFIIRNWMNSHHTDTSGGFVVAGFNAAIPIFAAYVLLMLLALWHGANNIGLGNWNILVALAVGFIAIPLYASVQQHAMPRWVIAILLLLSLLALHGLLIPSFNEFIGRGAMFALAIIPPLVATFFFWRSAPVQSPWYMVCFFLLGVITSCAITSLQNWQQLVVQFEAMPAQTALCLTIVTGIVAAFILKPNTANSQPRLLILRFLPYVIFAVLALRSDHLFLDGSAMHWEYFVGPIRTIRDGGWLLWDTPSQYGFLSILLPALIPTASSWDAFYVFQAATLFTAAALFYRTLHRFLGANRVISCMLVIASFFLAWPSLIGPSLFPSSSAVRFLWCYVLLYQSASVFLGSTPSVYSFVRRAAALWVLGVLWSAESAVYASVLFVAPIALHLFILLLRPASRQHFLTDALKLIGIPVTLFTAAILIICAVYLIGLGHLPDISMFSLYGSAYAGGFGAIPVLMSGPIWLYGFILCCGGWALHKLLQQDFNANGPASAVIAAMGCVWAISSYYIGRAVPNNIVAELPLLCFALLIMIRSAKDQQLQWAIAIPLLSLALLAPFWNGAFIPLLGSIAQPPKAASILLDQPDEKLNSLLIKAAVTTNDPVLYYGFGAVMPRGGDGTYEKTWLPTPPQLLEEPISEATRSKIIARYIQRHKRSGFFVQKLWEREDRVIGWLDLLSLTHIAEKTWQNDMYRIIHLVPR